MKIKLTFEQLRIVLFSLYHVTFEDSTLDSERQVLFTSLLDEYKYQGGHKLWQIYNEQK